MKIGIHICHNIPTYNNLIKEIGYNSKSKVATYYYYLTTRTQYFHTRSHVSTEINSQLKLCEKKRPLSHRDNKWVFLSRS